MGICNVALNFIVERGGKLTRSLLTYKQVPISDIKGLKYQPLTTDTVEISKAAKAKIAAQSSTKSLKIREKDILIDAQKTDSVDNILKEVIEPNKDYYINENGVLSVLESKTAKETALGIQIHKHEAEIQRAADTLNALKTFETDIKYYNASIERLSKTVPKIKGKQLDALLQKAPNITVEDIIQMCYAKTPEQFRPSMAQLEDAVSILNSKSFLTGKQKSLVKENAQSAYEKAINDCEKVKKRVAINEAKYSEITRCEDGTYQINIVSPLEPDKAPYDIIRITAEDKRTYEELIRTKYSDLVDSDLTNPNNVHAMHRILQRFSGATDKATPVDFEKMTKFLDYIKDIKANPSKYNVTGGIPQLANGDVRLGFQLVSGETSRSGCALAIPNKATNTYDMIILNKDGKITTTISGVKQSAIDNYFIPITKS